jgi:hypothetical protein
MQETIPCRVVLVNMHVKVSAKCPIWEIEVEDTKNMLFHCSHAKHIWRKLGLEELINQPCVIYRTRQVLLEYILCSKYHFPTILGQSNTLELITVTSCYHRWERPQATHSEKGKNTIGTAIAIGACTTLQLYRCSFS